jgi:hypothetical protein
MSDEERWALIWTAWIVGFAVAEAIALRSSKNEATLSHQTRRLLHARHPSRLRRRTGQVAFAAGVVWLFQHIWKEA